MPPTSREVGFSNVVGNKGESSKNVFPLGDMSVRSDSHRCEEIAQGYNAPPSRDKGCCANRLGVVCVATVASNDLVEEFRRKVSG